MIFLSLPIKKSLHIAFFLDVYFKLWIALQI